MLFTGVSSEQTSAPTISQKLKDWRKARRMAKLQAEFEARTEREELKYLVKGLVRHIDGASEGCRMTREISLEDRLSHSRLTGADKVMLLSGTLVMIGFLAARWIGT